MLTIYYRFWTRAINNALKKKKDDWKFETNFWISNLFAMNVAILIIWIEFLGLFQFRHVSTDLFGIPAINIIVNYIVEYLLPFFIINYILIFYKKRYIRIREKHDEISEKVATYYVIAVAVGFVLSVAIIVTINYFE